MRGSMFFQLGLVANTCDTLVKPHAVVAHVEQAPSLSRPERVVFVIASQATPPPAMQVPLLVISQRTRRGSR